MGRVISYLRVSTSKQDVESQEYELLRYAQQHNLHIDDWYRLEMSSRKSMADRKIDDLLSQLSEGDTLLVAELSRLGRSLSQIVFIIDALIAKGVIFIAVKQRIHLNGEHDMTTKISTTLFALMAEIERDLISERTKAGVAKARANGKLIGRPKGSRACPLDSRMEEIQELLAKNISKASIAKLLGVSAPSLHYFLRTRKIA